MTFYVAQATSRAATQWLLYLQGGGWCTEKEDLATLSGYSHQEDVGHPDLCSQRAKEYHGSTRWDVATRDFSRKGYLSGDLVVNPHFHNWNRVLLRNCDGTLFLGSREAPLQGLYFRGRDNFKAVIQVLLEDHGLSEATEIILGGCSAGAVAAVALADGFSETFQAATGCSIPGRLPVDRPCPFIAVLADSGIFPHWSQAPPPGVLHFPQFQWLFENVGAGEGLPKGCLEAGLGWRCLLVDEVLRYVNTPVFLLQSFVDSWQVASSSSQALQELSFKLKMAVLNALEAVNESGQPTAHSAAIDGCFHHCEAWNMISWAGLNNGLAFWRWYKARRQMWHRLQEAPQGNVSRPIANVLLHASYVLSADCWQGHEQHMLWHSELVRLP